MNAAQRAELLLLEHLDDQQTRDWVEYRYFFVKKSGRTFRIHDNGRICKKGLRWGPHEGAYWTCCLKVTSWQTNLPKADQALALKLLVESSAIRVWWYRGEKRTYLKKASYSAVEAIIFILLMLAMFKLIGLQF